MSLTYSTGGPSALLPGGKVTSVLKGYREDDVGSGTESGPSRLTSLPLIPQTLYLCVPNQHLFC